MDSGRRNHRHRRRLLALKSPDFCHRLGSDSVAPLAVAHGALREAR